MSTRPQRMYGLADSPIDLAAFAMDPDPSAYATRFTGKYTHRTISGGVGRNLPQEAPEAFVDAVIDVDGFAP